MWPGVLSTRGRAGPGASEGLAEQKHQISADHQEFSFVTQFLHVREAIEKCIYKWVAENSCHRTLLEKRDVSVLGRPILPQMMCHPRVAVYQISIVAVFTTGAEVEDNSRIYNRYEVFFVTPTTKESFWIPYWITVPALKVTWSFILFWSIFSIQSVSHFWRFTAVDWSDKHKKIYVWELQEEISCFEVRLYNFLRNKMMNDGAFFIFCLVFRNYSHHKMRYQLNIIFSSWIGTLLTGH